MQKHYDENMAIMLAFAIIKNLPPKEKRVSFYSRFVYTNNKTNLNKGKEEICLAYLFSFLGNPSFGVQLRKWSIFEGSTLAYIC